MKVKIIYEFHDGGWGGANQFLKGLKKEFQRLNIYTDNNEEADIFLMNSINAFHDYKSVCKLRRKYKNKIFVHRVDGPVFLSRGHDKYIDKSIFCINNNLADATIFQTDWSKRRCLEQGMIVDVPNITICNGADRTIFNDNRQHIRRETDKIKIIATSWSNNWNKGFEYYQYLDEKLDLDRFQFTFVGNSPIGFKRSKYYEPMGSVELAKKLNESDIYITASRNDACSNSLIEALNCSLPAVVHRDAGHLEIIGKGGIAFTTKGEMMEAIIEVANHLDEYKKNVKANSIEETAKEYIGFFNKILENGHQGEKDYKIVRTNIYIRMLCVINNFKMQCNHLLQKFNWILNHRQQS